MSGGAEALAEVFSAEFQQPVSDAATQLAHEVRRRCGDAPVAAVVFYGSCLRKQTDEGVLDFYAIVDDYRAASRSPLLAWANAVLPPNVHYLELDTPGGCLRAKYAVVSSRDLQRGVGTGSLRSSLWARFCQPVRAIYLRDDAAHHLLVRAATGSLLTLLERIVPLMPASDPMAGFGLDDLWQRAFYETYRYEMRPESPETIRQLYDAHAPRFDRVARLGLEEWAKRGGVDVSDDGDSLRVRIDPGDRRRARRTWRLRRPLAKLVYLAQLLKSAFTFGDWLPYALWKLERHTGSHIEPSERQRRHPLIFAWPLIFRVLRRRDLR